MKTPPSSLCQTITDRLLLGEKLAGQPELTAHVGSCLDCFRTLTELRELPRISEALRSDAAMETFGEDPGPAFWNAIPGRIADQVLETQKASTPARRAGQTRVGRWWAPAVLATGLAAAVFALATTHGPTATETNVAEMAGPARPGAGEATRPPDISDDDLRALDEAGADDEAEGAMEQLASLDSAELQRLTEALGQELR